MSDLKTIYLNTAAAHLTLAAAYTAMAGGDLSAPGPVAAPGAPAPTPGADPNFPSDPGKAPFPSPENSSSMVLGGHISGAPYVRSAQGAVYEILPGSPLSNEYGSGYQLSVNGRLVSPNMFVTQLLVRQGQVYFAFNNAGWGVFEQSDGIESGVQRTVPPAPWTTSGTGAGGGTVALPDMPAAPPAFTAWTGTVILFGDSQPLKTMQDAHDAAQPGDTIQAGPEMFGRATVQTLGTTKPIVLDLGGRITAGAGTEKPSWKPGMVLDVSALDASSMPHQLGAIVPLADAIIRGVDCNGAGMRQPTHDGTAAIRAGGPINLVVDHCALWKNQNGIGPSGFNGTLTVTNTLEIDNYLLNDPNPGGSHNVYALGVRATFGPGFTSIVNPAGGGGGHAIKSRAKETTLVEPFYCYSADSSSVDLPDGTTTICKIGAGTIAKKSGDANHTVLGYGVESQINGLAGVQCAGTTIEARCDNPLIGTIGPIAFDGACKFLGNKVTAPQGAPVTGLS